MNEDHPQAPTISACLIVRDEASVLDRCLASLEGVVDEIVVVDTGSRDDTKEVAGKYTERIYDFEWCDDFSAARNFANSKATGDWLLTIDADEYVPEDCRHRYKEAVKLLHETDYWLIMPRVYMLGQRGASGPDSAHQVFFGQRLLRRTCGVEWKNASHNVLDVPPERCVRAAPLKIHHDRAARHNLRNLQRARQRQRMNLANLRAAVEKDPRDQRSWFYLGNTHLDSGHHASAAKCYRNYLSITKEQRGHERWQVAYYLARWLLGTRTEEQGR